MSTGSSFLLASVLLCLAVGCSTIAPRDESLALSMLLCRYPEATNSAVVVAVLTNTGTNTIHVSGVTSSVMWEEFAPYGSSYSGLITLPAWRHPRLVSLEPGRQAALPGLLSDMPTGGKTLSFTLTCQAGSAEKEDTVDPTTSWQGKLTVAAYVPPLAFLPEFDPRAWSLPADESEALSWEDWRLIERAPGPALDNGQTGVKAAD